MSTSFIDHHNHLIKVIIIHIEPKAKLNRIVHPSARRILVMHLTTKFLDAVARAEDRSSSPLTLIWPMPGNVGGRLLSCSAFAEWQAFVLDISLRRAVPDIVAAKFERSQKLLLLAWIDGGLFLTGELVAMTALELALKDRYGDKVKRPNGSIHLGDTLCYMVEPCLSG